MKHKILLFASLVFLFSSCGTGSKFVRNKEAREDAEKLQSALDAQAKVPHTITADAETTPVNAALDEDSADDPAIYHNPDFPEKSIVIGTNKRKGLHTYNLQGNELDFAEVGKVNNVDVRSGFPFKGEKIILVSASNRTTKGITFFSLNAENGKLTQVGEVPVSSKIDDVYGYTMYHSPVDGSFYALANGKNGIIEQYKLSEQDGKVTGQLAITRKVKSQPEGMVVDEETQTLYVGVEEFYIQIFNAEPKPTEGFHIIESSQKEKNSFIEYDIEGLTIFKHKEKTYLVASIQGSFTYAIFDVTEPKNSSYKTSFAVIQGENHDGIEETDGLDIQVGNFGKQYPAGIFVAQDGFNTKGETKEKESQNFKIVHLEKIIDLIEK